MLGLLSPVMGVLAADPAVVLLEETPRTLRLPGVSALGLVAYRFQHVVA